MRINLRKEEPSDYEEVFQLIKAAFEKEVHSDHREQFLVERLRKSDAFIPELSIVAETDGEIIGHIMLTEININNGSDRFPSLVLSPVSVKPKYQNKGVGGKLIMESHRIAKDLGYHSIVLLGHEKYYPKFGYELMNKYGIKLPFDVPNENCMVISLTENGLDGVNGVVEYSEEFYK